MSTSYPDQIYCNRVGCANSTKNSKCSVVYLRRRTELAANKAPAEAGAIDVLDWLC